MEISVIERAKLHRKEKTIRRLGLRIFEMAHDPENSNEIRKNIIAILSHISGLSPSYLKPTNRSLQAINFWANHYLEEMAITQIDRGKPENEKVDPYLWRCIVPDLRAFGRFVNLTYFDLTHKELKVVLPKRSAKKGKLEEKVYACGTAYEYYKDVSNLMKEAKHEIIVTDRYVGEDLIELYLEKVSAGVKIRVLTRDPKGNFIAVAKKFKVKPNMVFEVRKSDNWHDRFIFIDNACWVSGQSLKDAATKVPTYLFRLEAFDELKQLLEDEWSKAIHLI